MNKFKESINKIEMKQEDKTRILLNILDEKDKRKNKLPLFITRLATIILAFLLLTMTGYAVVKVFNFDEKLKDYFGNTEDELEDFGVGKTDVYETEEFNDAIITINQTIMDQSELYITLNITGKKEAVYIEKAFITKGSKFDESTLGYSIVENTGEKSTIFSCNEGDIYGCNTFSMALLEQKELTTGYTLTFSITGEANKEETVTMRIYANNKYYDVTFTLSKNDIKTKEYKFDTVILNQSGLFYKLKTIIISPMSIKFDMESNVNFKNLTDDELYILEDKIYNSRSNNNAWVTFKDGNTKDLRLLYTADTFDKPYTWLGNQETTAVDIEQIESITINNIKFQISDKVEDDNSNELELTKKFNFNLNEKDVNIEVKFTAVESGYTNSYFVRGIYNDITFYDKEIYIHDDEKFDLNKTAAEFNENNFKVIKGEDNKDYLTIVFDSDYEDLLYVFNDKMELLTKGISKHYSVGNSDGYVDGFKINRFYNQDGNLENNVSPHYNNMFNTDNTRSYVKIENNKIYYLELIFNKENPLSDGVLEERVYTINNNKLNYEVIKTYKVLDVLNAN